MKRSRLGLFVMTLIVAACSTKPQRSGPPPPQPSAQAPSSAPAPTTGNSGPQLGTIGKYYDQDGPPLELPADLANRPDAQPRIEPLSATANRPYNIFGQPYVPMTSLTEFRQKGIGSWYGRMFHGRKTSSGEVYDMFAMTAAHPTLPIPSFARVTSVATGKQIIVRVNDRGPFLHNRVIDLSYAAAHRLGYAQAGSGEVEVELLTAELIAQIAAPASAPMTAPPMTAQPTTAPPASVSAVPPPAVLPAPLPALTVQSVPSPRDVPQASLPPVSSTASSPAASSPRAPASVPAPSSPSVGGPQYYVQLGAFSSRENAVAAQQRMVVEVGAVVAKSDVLLQDRLFKLQAGPFASRKQAEDAVAKIKQQTGANVFFVVR